MRPLFSYQQNRDFLAEILEKHISSKLKKGDLKQAKQTLISAYKFGYIVENPQDFDLRFTEDKQKLITLVCGFAGFNNLKLVTRKTIKERGWTDSLIEEYLWVDLKVKNPYYASQPKMRLYVLNRVIFVEENALGFKETIEQNLVRRFIKKTNKQNRLLVSPYQWVSAIGNYDIAVFLLARILYSEINRQNLRKHKDKIKSEIDRVTQAFPGVLSSFFCETSLSIAVDYDSQKDAKLLYRNSGWRNTSEALEGLSCLIDSQEKFIGMTINYNLINSFATESDIFKSKLNEEKKEMFALFLGEIKKIKIFASRKCPLKLDCQKMGFKSYFCHNFEACQNAEKTISN